MERQSAEGAILQAEEYEQHIPLLLSKQPAGLVHSVFQNGVNIRMGENLFFIGTTRNGQLPFGIHLAQERLQELLEVIEQDSAVSWDPAKICLTFGEGVPFISLENAVPFSWELSRREMTSQEVSDNLAMLVSVLLTEPRITGLGIDIESFLVTYLEKDAFVDPVGQHIGKLLTVLDTSDAAAIETELRYLLGRGKGLTPSGDDHLVGLLAIHAATGTLSITFIETLTYLLQNESLTTDIGKEYLLYAVQGKFSSSVVSLASALTQKTDIYMLKPLLSELLDMGHSSGIDTIFGMLLGLLARRRKLECQKK